MRIEPKMGKFGFGNIDICTIRHFKNVPTYLQPSFFIFSTHLARLLEQNDAGGRRVIIASILTKK